SCIFVFQAEDGIRDPLVTGVQTCALPIWLLSAKVDAKARVCVLQSWYSVPVRLAGRRVVVRLGAQELEVLDGGRVVAVHQRSLRSEERRVGEGWRGLWLGEDWRGPWGGAG